MSSKKLLLLSLCCSIALQGQEGECNPPAERYSPWVNWVMNKLSASDSLQEFAHQERVRCKQEVSSSVYADLFTKAQEEIGIPKESILPVVDLSVQDYPEMPDGFANTSPSKISVISENFDKCSYGAKRIIALHEAFHNKYHDACLDQWMIQQLGMATIISMGLSTAGLVGLNYKYVAPKGLRIAGYVGLPLVAIVTNMVGLGVLMYKSGLLRKPYSSCDYFKEYRADCDAVKHANCYQCVQEFAKVCGDKLPYLRQSELAAYVQSFQKEHKVCAVHKLHNQQS